MADSKLLVVPIVLFVLLFCNRSDAVIGDVIDSEALDLKPNQEIEKLKSKIETLGFKYEIGDAIDSESLDLKPKQEIEMLKAKIETLGIKYEIDDAIDSEALGLKPKQEIEKLKSKIEPLESITLERINELKRKNDQITHLGEVIKEKSAYIRSLSSEIELLQGVVEDEEAVRKVHAHNEELQNQIAKLQSKLEIQRERREALEVQVCGAEKEVNKLIGKLEKVDKTNGEQRAKIHDIEHALQVAEKDLIGARQEARTKSRELTKCIFRILHQLDGIDMENLLLIFACKRLLRSQPSQGNGWNHTLKQLKLKLRNSPSLTSKKILQSPDLMLHASNSPLSPTRSM